MKTDKFLAKHPVFTTEEWKSSLVESGSVKLNTQKALLTYYRNQGRVLPIRRGLYATIPKALNPKSFKANPYLITMKLQPDAILAYHTALEFHGKAYSLFNRLTYIASRRSVPLNFQSNEYVQVSVPSGYAKSKYKDTGIKIATVDGQEVRVTNLERTLVDVLHRPHLCGSWEEIWRSLGSIEFFDLDQVLEYTKLMNNATTSAKVGFFLDQHSKALFVTNSHLAQLWRLLPKQPHYMDRSNRKDCKLVKEWNLMVPTKILARVWEDVS